MPPEPSAYQARRSWWPGSLGRCAPGVEPRLDPDVGLGEVAAGYIGADGEEHHAEDQVAGAAGGDPQQRDEQGEEEGGEADVVLQAHDADGEGPGQKDGDQRPGVDDQAVARAGPWGW